MCCNRELTEQALKLLVMLYTDDLKDGGGRHDPLNIQIEYKSSLTTFSREFSHYLTTDKL